MYAPFLTNGFNLPDPVLEELLIPRGAFARNHTVNTFDYALFSCMQHAVLPRALDISVGTRVSHRSSNLHLPRSENMPAQPALYVLKHFVVFDVQILAAIQPGFLATAAHNYTTPR
ncbi:hypothetical protein B0H12DRAFT_1140766 [Mycena haematopus]|nr:hypothetical protein B0H12DRAFT_1140766 [Mycena haematopus]